MEERLNEILERLAALERRLDRMERESSGGHRADAGVACPFRSEERRIVDLIVGLTTAHVTEAMDARMQGPPRPPPGWHGAPGHHGHGPRGAGHDAHDHRPPRGGPPGSWGGPPPPPGWPHGDR